MSSLVYDCQLKIHLGYTCIALKKLQLPSTCITALGFHVDTHNTCFRITEKRLFSIARVVGTLSSAYATFYLIRVGLQESSQYVSPTPEFCEELALWAQVGSFNGSPQWWPERSSPSCSSIVI